MHRIDSSGNVSNMWSNGTPGVTAGTLIDDVWMNAVQEEIVGIILAAGITLVKGTFTQLHSALSVLYQKQVTRGVITVTGGGASVSGASNITSVSRVGTGSSSHIHVVFTNPFPDSNLVPAFGLYSAGTPGIIFSIGSASTTSVDIYAANTAGVAIDFSTSSNVFSFALLN